MPQVSAGSVAGNGSGQKLVGLFEDVYTAAIPRTSTSLSCTMMIRRRLQSISHQS